MFTGVRGPVRGVRTDTTCVHFEDMADAPPAPKRPRTDAEMPPPAKVPDKSAATAAAGGASSSSTGAKILTSVDDVLAAISSSPKEGAASAPAARDVTSPQCGQHGASPSLQPMKSPAYPNLSVADNANHARLKPNLNLSSEPPPLDLGFVGAFESPALMPISALGNIPAMDYLGPQMNM